MIHDLAHHMGAELILPRHLVGAEVRRRILLPGDIRHTQRPGEVVFVRYHPNPVFPSQELFFLMFWVGIHVLWRFAAIRKAVQMLLRPAATG